MSTPTIDRRLLSVKPANPCTYCRGHRTISTLEKNIKCPRCNGSAREPRPAA